MLMKTLLIEDDETDARMVQIALARHGGSARFQLTVTDTLAAGLGALEASEYDAVLVDLNLPDASGSQSVDAILNLRRTTPIIVLSGNDDDEFAISMIAAGAQDFLVKGGDGLRLLPRALRYAVERKRAETRLKQLASVDTLTALANRRELQDQLHKAIARAQRQGDMMAMLLLDLDKFKAVNDTHGHDVGDAVLRAVGERLRGLVRASDTAARIGGDEFAVILESLPHAGAAAGWAAKALAKLNEPIDCDGLSLSMGFSIGGALFPGDGTSADALTKSADVALYAVKDGGRNNIAFFDAQMGSSRLRKQALASSIHTAIDNREFGAAFQPIVSLESGEVLGAEALCRWYRPDGEAILPGEFLPILRAKRLMPALGRQMLAGVVSAMREFDNNGHPLPVSINVDMQELRDERYASELIETLCQAGIDPALLSVDLVPDTFLNADAATQRNLATLRDAGVGITLDDFGASQFPLHLLRKMPINALKLDRTLLSDIGNEHQQSVIVQSLVALGHELGVEVIAEGIETRVQLTALLEMGCRSGFGFLVSRPMSTADFNRWMPARAERLRERLQGFTGVFRALAHPDNDSTAVLRKSSSR